MLISYAAGSDPCEAPPTATPTLTARDGRYESSGCGVVAVGARAGTISSIESTHMLSGCVWAWSRSSSLAARSQAEGGGAPEELPGARRLPPAMAVTDRENGLDGWVTHGELGVWTRLG